MTPRNTDILNIDIRADLSAHPVSGDITTLINEQAIRQAIINLVRTPKYSRPFNRDVGSVSDSILFENMSAQTSYALEKSIREVIENHDSRVGLSEVIVTPFYEKNAYKIEITYFRAGSDEASTFNYILERTR